MSAIADIFGEGSAIWQCGQNKEHEVGKLADRISSKALVNRQALTNILVENFSFPDQNRVILWRFLLQLPMNKDAYNIVSHQDIHKGVKAMMRHLPIKFSVIGNRMTRILSSLSYWHPPLAECDWLPALVFPFIQVCGRDSLIAFEIIATVLTNWCSEWLHFVPNPPITILSRIDHIARKNGGEAPLAVAWPVLRSFFGEVATTKAALMILDNILASKPVFIEYMVAAYAVTKDKIIDELNVVPFLKKARQMYRKDMKTEKMSNTPFQPLPKGYYPVMVIVQKSPMWREKELERIRTEAADLKQMMDLSEQIEKESDRINRHRKNWMEERKILKLIEQEQMAEFRRIEKQTICHETKAELRAMEEKKKQMEQRRVVEMAALGEWVNDCDHVRQEIEESIESTKKKWQKWLDLKEQGAAMAREEVESEIDLIQQRADAQKREIEQYQSLMDRAAREEEATLANVVTRSKKMDEEKFALKERMEQTRARHAEEFLRSATSSPRM